MRAEQVTDPVAHHAEGPVWSDRWGGLRWVDMLAGDVLSLAADGTVARRHVGDVAAALRPRSGGGAVIAVERGFALEGADGTLTPLEPVWSDPGVRMNEGGCDPDGRFWCGSMAYDQRPGAAALYRLDPDGQVHRVLEGVTISNGLDWSPDGSLAYYDDTATHRVDVFDYDRETGLTARRPFVRLPDDRNPDGLTVDAEGGVWVALWGGSAVQRHSAEGAVDERIDLPVTNVTSCCFGDSDLGTLYVTTARRGAHEPLAGALFACRPGVTGLPATPFAG
jgi:sugar lactone lactonase YvrE